MEETPSIIHLMFDASAVICDCKGRHGVGGDGNCSDSVGVGTHRRPHGTAALAVSPGGGGMACTTVGVGNSSTAHMVGAGDDGMMGIDIHTAVGAGSEDVRDGEMVGVDCHTVVGTGSV